MTNERDPKLALSSLMFGIELTLSLIDNFEKTYYFKHGVKQSLNLAKKQLEPFLDHEYYLLLQQDEELIMGISDKLAQLAHQIGQLEIGQMCAVSEAIPEIISKENNVKLKKLSA